MATHQQLTDALRAFSPTGAMGRTAHQAADRLDELALELERAYRLMDSLGALGAKHEYNSPAIKAWNQNRTKRKGK